VALDEAEGIIAMVAEWLELDSLDDGIRHDAEIVRLFYLFASSGRVQS
jgi:hypothetical protein